jgi:hypothetical protein
MILSKITEDCWLVLWLRCQAQRRHAKQCCWTLSGSGFSLSKCCGSHCSVSATLFMRKFQQQQNSRPTSLWPGEAELAWELLDVAVDGELVLLETVGRLEALFALLTGIGTLASVVHYVTFWGKIAHYYDDTVGSLEDRFALLHWIGTLTRVPVQ